MSQREQFNVTAGCSGKHPYPSRALAQRAVERAARNENTRRKDCFVSAYRCPKCGRYHIGSRGRPIDRREELS